MYDHVLCRKQPNQCDKLIMICRRERGTQSEAHEPLSSPFTDQAPSNKSTRRGDRPSPHRASVRGGANAQVTAEQVCEAGRTTKSPSSQADRKGGAWADVVGPRRPRQRHNVTKSCPHHLYGSRGGSLHRSLHPRTRKDRTTHLARARTCWRVAQGSWRKIKSY
jgi:hypothetical protein